MKFRKIVKNKKIIVAVLATIVAFTAILFSKPKTDIKTVETQKIEMTNQNKTISIKNKGEMITMKNANMTTMIIKGKEYKVKEMQVKATAYSGSPSEGGMKTYMGTRCRKGVLAVDKNVIPLGTKVYIPQFDMIFTCEDTGSKIKGNRIDIFMNSKWECKQWGIKNITIYVLE